MFAHAAIWLYLRKLSIRSNCHQNHVAIYFTDSQYSSVLRVTNLSVKAFGLYGSFRIF